MRTAAHRLGTSTCIVACLLASSTTSAAFDEKREKAKLLTRSIYLPVELKLCEHLRDAVLYQDEEVVSLLPAKRIFQFTYYPELRRIEPARSDLRVEGIRSDGSQFIGRLAVTAWGVFTANRKIELDMDQQLRKMRFKLDVRYQPVLLKMNCDDACGRAATTADGSALQQEN